MGLDIYFILWFITQYCYYLFCCSNCLSSGHWEAIQLASFPSDTLILPFFSQYFLFFDTVKHSWILLYFPYPSTRIKHFPKKLWFPFTAEFYLETKVLGLDVLTDTGVLLNPFSGQGYECVYMPTNVEIYIYNCFCIYLSRYVLS